jgi:ribosomal protein S12 methylthiotransferase accessory factor
VDVAPDEGLFLLSEGRQVVLRGRLYELVAPLLDGRPVEEVCERLRGRATPAEVFYALAQLEKKGHVAEADDELPAHEAALWSAQGVAPAAVARRLAEKAVALRVVGDVDVGPFRDLLGELRVRLADEGTLLVVAADSPLRQELGEVNAAALRDGVPWLLVLPLGRQVWLGPLFRPGKTGCWACLAERVRANAPVVGYLEGKRGHTGETVAGRAWSAATVQVAWGLAASAVTVWVATGELPHLEGKIQTLDALTGQSATHALARLPDCPACAGPATPSANPEPLTLSSRKKTFTGDGGHRAVSPRQTLERYGHHVSPITGAVSMLERDGPPGQGIMHVYLSGHNVARRIRSWAGLREGLRNSNCGKGVTDEQAKASALCEGLERYSAVFRGDEPRLRASLRDLGDAAVHPNEVMLFSERQYRERDE